MAVQTAVCVVRRLHCDDIQPFGGDQLGMTKESLGPAQRLTMSPNMIDTKGFLP